ncbi:S49 family peptidase [Halorientalis sp. IM1011]|uniref:S49 family peptidase n=1 Tax=Halorientalis sp. IM1011 TaxID=1932360 RepID=UPI00097CC511|nr:S49 family peptidase [Halorientalis sp. IM1011]AQL42921.1 S49 family peptidase [Halorientalis sp. IM1011]
MSRDPGLLDRLGGPVVVFGVVGLVVGAALVPYAWGATTDPDGTVAVVEMHGTINGDTATAAIEDLREARQNDSIEAVVLDINSGGGLASVSEQLYLAVKRTSEQMPVKVAVTGMAASGAYYMSAPADGIYVTPASTVGSVGVRAVVPQTGAPDNQITTGPDKVTGATEDEARQRVEALRRAFVDSVVAEREDELNLSATELSYAKVYSGTRSVELGLADEVGGLDAAVNAAAEDAGLSDYRTVRKESPTPSTLSSIGLNGSGGTASDGVTVETTQYLMLHGQLKTPDSGNVTEVSADGGN